MEMRTKTHQVTAAQVALAVLDAEDDDSVAKALNPAYMNRHVFAAFKDLFGITVPRGRLQATYTFARVCMTRTVPDHAAQVRDAAQKIIEGK
jgi:hypothetical protein